MRRLFSVCEEVEVERCGIWSLCESANADYYASTIGYGSDEIKWKTYGGWTRGKE